MTAPSSTSPVSLRLLGRCEFRRGEELVHLETTRAAALLAYLALAGAPQPRQKLLGLLWGHLPEEKARANLRHTLWHLRTRFPGEIPLIETTQQTVAFNRQAGCRVDVAEFEACLENEGQMGNAQGSPQNRYALLGQALDLYEGDLLEGLYIDDSPGYDEWLIVERERLRALAVQALQRLVGYYLSWGEYEAGIHYARRLLGMEPWQEEAHRQLMRLLLLSGQRSAALAQYETCRQALAEELGVEPAPETQALVETIRQSGEAAGAAPAGGGRPGLAHLPPQTTPFVGREGELARLAQLLGDPACRLISLVGPGGIGKTRLAVRFCTGDLALSFPDGIFFVPLVGVSSPDLLIPAISDAIGLAFHANASPPSQLLGFLKDKATLLVLDNFEYLLDGAGMVSKILQAAPGVKILVTSRRRLDLGEEWLFEVGGLDIPPLERTDRDPPDFNPPDHGLGDYKPGDHDPAIAGNLDSYSAVRLFTQGVQRIRLDFSLSEENRPAVARICRLVEGMPLALELAAAWARTLSCEEIASEVAGDLDLLVTSRRDLPERHRSMRVVFEHSWQRLSDAERDALKRLSVFQGGFQRQAASEVSGVDLALLSALVDQSLLHCTTSGRYELHELLRQYAAEKLTLPESAQTRDSHCRYFAGFLEAREVDIAFSRLKDSLAEVGGEIENVRAAWDWAVQTRQPEPIAQALHSLYRFYEMRNWFMEGEAAFSRAAAMLISLDGPENSLLRARILQRQARFCQRLAQYTRARELLYECLGRLALEGPEHNGIIGGVQLEMGIIALMTGDYREAQTHLQASLEFYQSIRHDNTISSMINLGYVACQVGQYGEAGRLLQEMADVCQQKSYHEPLAFSWYYLGLVNLGQGRTAEAGRLFENGLSTFRDLGHRWGMALSLQGLALAALENGDYPLAARLAGEGLESARQIHDAHSTALCLNCLGRAAFGLGKLDEAIAWHIQTVETAWQAHQPPPILDGLIGLGEVWAAEGRNEAACELLWLAQNHPAAIERERRRAGRLLADCAARLPGPAFSAACQRGEAARLDEVAQVVLRSLPGRA